MGLMSRSMVGLLAAIGVALSGLATYAHGAFIWATIAGAATAGGLAAFLGFVSIKKNCHTYPTVCMRDPTVCVWATGASSFAFAP